MDGLTPASVEDLPQLGDLVADEPFWRYRAGGPDREDVAHLRVLAHDLSNALEAILQASYLLSHGKLETESKRWAHLIETSSEDAARINREMRKLMRSLGEE